MFKISHRKRHTYLFNAGSILLHGDLLGCALKPKKRFNVHTSRLLKTGPVFILWVNLKSNQKTIRILLASAQIHRETTCECVQTV